MCCDRASFTLVDKPPRNARASSDAARCSPNKGRPKANWALIHYEPSSQTVGRGSEARFLEEIALVSRASWVEVRRIYTIED
jgi:hypothetical protein